MATNEVPKTRLLTSLQNSHNKPSIGSWLELPGYTLASTIASLVFYDWILIDCEHGNISDTEMYHCVAAIASHGVSPIIRIPGSEPWMIKRALDAGAHGIMVPMVETVEQAEKVARAARYPPTGVRGTGGLFAPTQGGFGVDARGYMKNANHLITVIVQIESPLGVQNCEDIAAVEGIDALFIGPNDLASSMGFFAFDHGKIPEVQEAGRKVLKAAKGKGKFAGYFCLNAEEAKRKIEEGWGFVNLGADIVAITSWMGSEMGKLRGLIEEEKGS